ncbi:MAG TPA: hypothetical protein VF829_01235 [Candidatus Paceibacterota bacterium]
MSIVDKIKLWFTLDPEVDFQLALREETIARNYKKAAWLYQKAVDGGHYKAKFFLAEMYLDGRGVDKDTDKAMKLLDESASAGYDKAKRLLRELN